MTRQLKKRYPGPGGMFALSFAIHVAIFLLILKGQLLPEYHPDQEPVTYVDIATLPVASPQSGTPAPAAAAAKEPAAESVPATSKEEMALPAPKPKLKQSVKAPAPSKQKTAQQVPPKQTAKQAAKKTADEDERAFQQRMAKLEQQADDRRMGDVMARLKSRAGNRTGMPGGKGTQAGSDYTSYVKSRIQDAINAYGANPSSKAPKILVTISVGSDGRIDFNVENKSGDSSYNTAVTRAIKSIKSIKPPPGGGQFKHEFLFEYTGKGVAVQ